MERKRLNKQKREQLKKEKADTFNSFFSYGYDMGYNQAIRDMKKGIDLIEKEVRSCKETL